MKIIPLSIPTPFYVGDVNIYLIEDDPLTLIDVGPKTAQAERVLREKLRSHSVDFSDIKRILLTHTHEDHCGLAKILREKSGAEIFVHRWETGHLDSRLNAAQRSLLFRSGVPGNVLDEFEKMSEKAAALTDALAPGEFSELRDEAEIEFTGGVLKVLHTPGHTPGSCSFLRESDRTIIAGDTVLKRVTPNPMIAPDPFDHTKRFASLGEFLVSLAKIKSSAPTLVYGGHYEPIEDYAEIFNRYVRAVDERQKGILKIIPPNGANAYETARKLFPDAIDKGFHGFLAISETVAHLDYAAQNGRLQIEIKDGTEIYRK